MPRVYRWVRTEIRGAGSPGLARLTGCFASFAIIAPTSSSDSFASGTLPRLGLMQFLTTAS